jgi:hypothetical protein
MLPERNGCIDEGADARRGLGCAERDSELHLPSKVRERPEYDLREAQSAHRFRPQHHAVAGGGHAERRHEIADVMDDLDREAAGGRQPLLSRQLWSFLVDKGAIPDARAFIRPCPHMSFVRGAGNVAFLRQRFKEMSAHHCFRGMEYSEDRSKIAEWAPLLIDRRSPMFGLPPTEPWEYTPVTARRAIARAISLGNSEDSEYAGLRAPISLGSTWRSGAERRAFHFRALSAANWRNMGIGPVFVRGRATS